MKRTVSAVILVLVLAGCLGGAQSSEDPEDPPTTPPDDSRHKDDSAVAWGARYAAAVDRTGKRYGGAHDIELQSERGQPYRGVQIEGSWYMEEGTVERLELLLCPGHGDGMCSTDEAALNWSGSSPVNLTATAESVPPGEYRFVVRPAEDTYVIKDSEADFTITIYRGNWSSLGS